MEDEQSTTVDRGGSDEEAFDPKGGRSRDIEPRGLRFGRLIPMSQVHAFHRWVTTSFEPFHS